MSLSPTKISNSILLGPSGSQLILTSHRTLVRVAGVRLCICCAVVVVALNIDVGKTSRDSRAPHWQTCFSASCARARSLSLGSRRMLWSRAPHTSFPECNCPHRSRQSTRLLLIPRQEQGGRNTEANKFEAGSLHWFRLQISRLAVGLASSNCRLVMRQGLRFVRYTAYAGNVRALVVRCLSSCRYCALLGDVSVAVLLQNFVRETMLPSCHRHSLAK